VITDALDTRLDTAEADPTTQTLLNVEKSRIDTNVTAIGLNTAKNSFPTASNTLLHTTHPDLHTSHTASLLLKAPSASPTFTGAVSCNGHFTVGNSKKIIIDNSGNGEVADSYADDLQIYKYNGAGLTIGSPEGMHNTIAFSDQNHASRNMIRAYSAIADSRNVGMHMFSNQSNAEVPSFSVCDQLIGINNAQPSVALDVVGDVRINGNVGFYNTTPVAQHSTNGLQAGASQNSGPAVLLGSAFSGNTGSTSYTMGDVVKCLKDCGLLAP
jgi:hypothetical protein